MPLPSLDKTWLTDFNNAVVANTGNKFDTSDATQDRKQVMVEIKDALVASAQWSVKGSAGGNGTGFGGTPVADATDNWVDGADLRWRSASNLDRSWIVLANTALDLEVLIDCVSAAGNDGTRWNVWVSRPVLDGGGGFAIGPATLSVRPVAPDEQLASNGEVNADTWGVGDNDATARDWVWNTWVSNDGEVTRVIILFANVVSGFWEIAKAKNPVDANDVFFKFLNPNNLSTNSSTFAQLHDTSADRSASHYKAGAPLLDTFGRGPNIFMTSEGFGTQPCGQQFTTVNDVDNAFGLFPVGYASLQPGYTGRMGEAFDLYWGLDNNNNGDTYPGAGTKLWAQFGDLVFPWDGTAPLLA